MVSFAAPVIAKTSLTMTRWALEHSEDMQRMATQAKQRVLEFSQTQMIRETLGTLESLAHACN